MPKPTVNASNKVVVPEWLIVNPSIVLPFEVIDPVPTIVTSKLVYSPPTASIKVFTFMLLFNAVLVEPVKFNMLNQLPPENEELPAPT